MWDGAGGASRAGWERPGAPAGGRREAGGGTAPGCAPPSAPTRGLGAPASRPGDPRAPAPSPTGGAHGHPQRGPRTPPKGHAGPRRGVAFVVLVWVPPSSESLGTGCPTASERLSPWGRRGGHGAGGARRFRGRCVWFAGRGAWGGARDVMPLRQAPPPGRVGRRAHLGGPLGGASRARGSFIHGQTHLSACLPTPGCARSPDQPGGVGGGDSGANR